MQSVRPAEVSAQNGWGLAPRAAVILPFGLVLLSLLCLAFGPFHFLQRAAEFRRQLSDVIDPAETDVAEVQLALALEEASARGYLLTRQPLYVESYLRARAERERALRELLPLTRQIGAAVAAQAEGLNQLLSRPMRQDSLFRGLLSVDAARRSFATEQERFHQAIAAAVGLDRAINEVAMTRRTEALSASRAGSMVSLLSAIFALLAALLVARLGRQYRQLALRLDEEVHTQVALREELRESEHRLRQILESIEDGFLSLDREWRFSYVNPRADQLIRAMARPAPSELLGRSLWEAIPELAGSDFAAMHERAMRERIPLHTEAYFQPWHRWFDVRDYPWENGLSIFFQDVTERKEEEEERAALLVETQERRLELERVMESRARLIRGFTHDLKNPLGAADGFAQLLEGGVLGELAPKQKEGVGRIRASLDSALRLIGDLLELSRAETGQIELHCEDTDIGRELREVAEEHRAHAASEGLTLEVHTPDTPLRTRTDPMRVRQALGNLIGNAVKYTEEGGISVSAEERADGPGAGRWVAVEIRDTGPGIPEGMRERIFEEFERLDTRRVQGAGIGLAISRRVARLLGGEITVDSEPGVGSTFTLWLPLTPAAPSAD
jgi:PAS domain S-box-containing protein